MRKANGVKRQRSPRSGEVWVDSAKARGVWATLSVETRRQLRDKVGEGPDSRIRGDTEKADFSIVADYNAKTWASIAGLTPETFLICDGPPTPSDDLSSDENHAEEERASKDGRTGAAAISEELEGARSAITAILARSVSVTDAFVAQLSLDIAESGVAARAKAVASALIGGGPVKAASVKTALRTAKAVRLKLDARQGRNEAVHKLLHAICSQMLRLIYTEAEIGALREAFEKRASVLIDIPAANATFAEVVMARLDRRGLRLEPYRGGAQRKGVNLIPASALTDPDSFNQCRADFRAAVFAILLNSDEEDESEAEKEDICRRRLKNRFPEEKGSLYFLSTSKLNPDETKGFEAMVERLAAEWPAIRFARPTRDAGVRAEQRDLIDEVLDMLPEEEA